MAGRLGCGGGDPMTITRRESATVVDGIRSSTLKLHLLQHLAAQESIRTPKCFHHFEMVVIFVDEKLHRLIRSLQCGGEIACLALELRRLVGAMGEHEGFQASGAAWILPFYFAQLAIAHAKAGKPEDGLGRLSEALVLTVSSGVRWFEAELHRHRGELLRTAHPRAEAEAEASFCRAIEIARRQNAKLWELRAAVSLARLRRDQGKRDEARAPLAPIYGWFAEGLDTPDLLEAKALLDELSA
jgi:hypothetical protein